MAIPNQAAIEIPLLLELGRAGGKSRPSDLYERLSRHFPGLTEQDMEQERQSTGVSVWQNCVAWSRNELRTKGELNGGQTGIWEITGAGRARLRRELGELGVGDVGAFIASGRTMPEEIGSAWQPEPLRQRPRVSGRRKEQVTVQPPRPVVEQATTQEVQPPPPPREHKAQSPIEERLFTRLLALNPSQFEKLLGEFLKARGFSDVHVTGRAGDGGIDGECSFPFIGLNVSFQAKRYAPANSIGAPAIRNFKGGIVGRFDRGIFITTSTFTAGAREEADQPGVTIVLIDGVELVKQMIVLELGVKTVPVVEKQVDEGFFVSL